MWRKIPIFIMVLALLLFSTAIAGNFVNNGYQLGWWSVDGGGGVSTGEDYLLHGTAGQYDAGSLQGGSYSLSGGYSQPSESGSAQEKVMLPFLVG